MNIDDGFRMCILSSREQTCIDPEVSQMTKKNEECKNKRDVCRIHPDLFISVNNIMGE